MTEIQLEPGDRNDILKLLDYALQKKIEEDIQTNTKRWAMSEYWKIRIPQLKMLIKGKKYYDNTCQSSLGNLIKDIAEGTDENSYFNY